MKIVGYGDCGFAMLMSYHRAREGFVGKMPVDYKKVGEFSVSAYDMVQLSADDRVQLYYNSDGFEHFSGEVGGTITSGIDRSTGKPKSVGLRTPPLPITISSGPSAGIVASGLDDFDGLEADDEGAVVFHLGDLYFRGCTPETATRVLFEILVFPKRYWEGVRRRLDEFVLSMAYGMFEATGCVIDMKVIGAPGRDILLAAFASHAPVAFPSVPGCRWGGRGKMKWDGTGEVLMA